MNTYTYCPKPRATDLAFLHSRLLEGACLAFFLLVSPLQLSAQESLWNVPSPSGAYFQDEDSGYNLHWVAGQTAITTLSTDDTQLHQGFLQSSWVVVAIEEATDILLHWEIAPNPVMDQVRINTDVHTPFTIQLHNGQGQMVRIVEVNETPFRLNLTDLAAGPYFLSAYSSQDGRFPTVKILKIK